MANLLDQASIVLTPTAYDNGKVLCAKPSEPPYGDFDFSRNSAATRVNAQGLVENVQILSSNLVQNGDFSEEGVQEVSNGSFSQEGVQEVSNGSFSQEGAELVTNGSFDTDTDWTILNSAGATTNISGGSLNIITNGAFSQASQDSILTSGKSYVLDYTITSNAVVGSLAIVGGSSNLVVPSIVGTHSFYFEADGAGFAFKRGGGALNVSIDNVSVREVGQDWTLGGEVTIGDNLAHFESNTNTYSYVRQDISSLTSKTYKIQLEVKNYVSGEVQVAFSGVSPISQNLNVSTDGVYTAYLTPNANGDDFEVSRRFLGGNFNFDITNISVKEAAQDWTLGTGWSIGEDKAVYSDGAKFSQLKQTLTNNNTSYYKVTFDAVINSGQFRVKFGSNNYDIITTTDTYTIYGIFSASNTNITFEDYDDISSDFSITNISVKEVGMDWNTASGWIISDDKLNFDSNDNEINYTAANIVGSPFVVGKKYRATLTNLEILGGIVEFKFGRNYNTIPARPILTSADNGTYVDEFVAVSTSSSFTISNLNDRVYGSIGSVSVIEITDDTNLPRINYEGFSYQDALGSEEVVNGDFSNGTTGWGITNASYEVSNGELKIYNQTSSPCLSSQSVIGLIVGKQYKVSVTSRLGGSGGNVARASFFGNIFASSNGQSVTETIIITATSTSGTIGLYVYGTSSTEGYFDNVSVKEYLGQEVVPDSGCGSWLFEPQSTNLITQSELFSDASWNNGGIGTLPTLSSGFLAPDGTNTAFKISNPNKDSFWRINNPSLTQNGARSIYARTTSGSGTISLLSKNDNTNNTFTLTEQWQRFDLNETLNAITFFYAVDFRGVGNTLDELIVWGAQAEALSYPTSYIPTEGSSVTRNQDVCNNGGSLASINSTEGVLYAEIAALVDTDLSDRVISLSDNTITNRVELKLTATGSIQGRFDSATSDTTLTKIGISTTNTNKIALYWESGKCALWINGIKEQENLTFNTFASNALIDLSFNSAFSGGSSNFFGKTKALAVWKEALSDQELADLTYPTPTDPTFALDFDTIATDFTFARGSEATYVDAQGLIQSTNEIGSELVVNGTFDTDLSGWNNSNNYWQWSSQGAYFPLTTTHNPLSQVITNDASAVLKFTFTLTIVQGTANVYYQDLSNATVSQQFTQSGTYTIYTVPVKANTSINFSRYGGINTEFYIDNVSVKEYITATNTPRLDYSTGAEAFLLEPQSTNLVTYSENFSGWASNYTSLTSGFNSPDGASGATLLSGDGVNVYPNISRSAGSAGDVSYSVFVKKELSDEIALRLQGTDVGGVGNVNAVYTYTFSTNSFASASSGVAESFSAQPLVDGWVRLELNFTSTTITACRIYPAYGTASTDGVYIWGAQLEALPYATSYIPTAGTTVTRNQETCINATPEINSEEGVLYAEIAALGLGASASLGLNDGSGANRVLILLQSNGDIRGFVASNNTIVFDEIYSGISTLNNNKIAVSYKLNQFSLWINGVKRFTDTIGNTPIGLNQLDFDNGSGASNFYGNTKDVQVYAKALSDAELIKLTT